MYNIKALEDEWKRYRRKKRRPFYFLLLFCVVVSAISVFIWLNNKTIKLSTEIADNSVKKKKVSSRIVYIDKPIVSLERKKTSIEIDAPIDLSSVKEVQDHPIKRKTKRNLHIEVIDIGSDLNSFKTVEKRFRLGHNTEDSLFLAKNYYKRGNYKKAEYWALQTNRVNDNLEESWLIFAKAKAKRGHRNEAIRVLNNFIKRSHSIEAKILLEKIKLGKRI